MVVEVTDANFDEVVLKSEVPVIVDFWAIWCGPCRMIHPIIEEMDKEFEGKALMVRMDVDAHPATAAKFGIRNIPTLLFFKNGEQADKQVGVVPKKKLVEKLEALL